MNNKAIEKSLQDINVYIVRLENEKSELWSKLAKSEKENELLRERVDKQALALDKERGIVPVHVDTIPRTNLDDLAKRIDDLEFAILEIKSSGKVTGGPTYRG